MVTKTASKKPAAKKAATKKAATKKPAAKKAATKNAATKQAAAKKPVAAAKKPAAKKAAAPAKKGAARATPKVSAKKGTSLADYARALAPWQSEALGKLRALIARHAPESTASIKWSQPVFELAGPFAFVRPAKAHVTIGFWRGAEFKDPGSVLTGEGDRMKHVKLAKGEPIDEALISGFIGQAVALNRAKGDPTKRG